jgi:cell division protein FtsB
MRKQNFSLKTIKESWDNFSIPAFLKNKYVISVIVFFVWVTFFDQNNLLTQFERGQDLRHAKAKKGYYKEQIEFIRENLDEITHDAATIEKFARENYYMKKDNEEVFVIVEK